MSHIRSLAIYFVAVVIASLHSPADVFGDLFGTGANTFTIDFVTIGDPGNPAHQVPPLWSPPHSPVGSVPYVYRMGEYEISEQMINKAVAASAGSAHPLQISIDTRGPDKPATSISWIEAAQFVNWLNTSAGYSPAYKFVTGINPPPPLQGFTLWEPSDPGYDPANLFRNSQAHYFLPSLDEWHKAAYYDPAREDYSLYPNGSVLPIPPTPVVSGSDPNTAVYGHALQVGPADITAAGGRSPYGTVGQGGNVWEFLETEFDRVNDDPSSQRMKRGGDWESTSGALRATEAYFVVVTSNIHNVGFRVASVPEPNTALLSFAILSCLGVGRRVRN